MSLDQLEPFPGVLAQARPDGRAKGEVENTHAGMIGKLDRNRIAWMIVDPFAEDKHIGAVEVNLAVEFLPKPDRHVLDRIDAQGVDPFIQPHLDRARDVAAIADVVFVESGQAAKLAVLDLPLVVPILDVAVVVIPPVLVVIEVGRSVSRRHKAFPSRRWSRENCDCRRYPG